MFATAPARGREWAIWSRCQDWWTFAARVGQPGPKQIFLVASVDLVGDHAESHIAHTLRKPERELKRNPHIVDVVLTVAESDQRDVDTDDHDRP
ncbi:cation diffusion facilitator family transporter [Rhodococcus opacus RKJ300 = JCM 13270]|uniref:Cation diffusion facilitator family transporter n=1 Tax=Rhodococcus opacus RKJ300 = JCM 13270 TaxID=1165867 RepID=I0WXD3_RHOOP|nr:cation diffusion facilitator family transporter [Rhodococcus opacus RKJ300 = JCM 13270]